ncbi:MAG: superoxide dismutase [Thermoflexales bacterium]|nr:superoxide dismutase [Thermoflexales bacterium]
MPFELPPLPYAFTALEPHIDAMTMEIHHDRHHKAYVDNLNNALKEHSALQALSIEQLLARLNDVPESVRTAVRNNGGGHFNHSLFWNQMKTGGSPLGGAFKDALVAAFGSEAAFKEQFVKAGLGRFGSGWAWLVVGKDHKLAITSTPNQDTPVMDGIRPLLGVDVWEHAYYLKYQNKRQAYIEAWFNVVDWADVAARYAAK